MPTGHYERYPGLNDGVAEGQRRCSKCMTAKPRDAFSPDRRKSTGLQSTCKVCRKQREADWRASNPEEHKARCHADYLKHRASKDARGLIWRKKNPDRVRGYALKLRYGLTSEEHQAMRDAQDGQCAICAKAFKRTPHTDHDHLTGKVRGLLCAGCNILVGHIETPGRLDAVQRYLAHHSARQSGVGSAA